MAPEARYGDVRAAIEAAGGLVLSWEPSYKVRYRRHCGHEVTAMVQNIRHQGLRKTCPDRLCRTQERVGNPVLNHPELQVYADWYDLWHLDPYASGIPLWSANSDLRPVVGPDDHVIYGEHTRLIRDTPPSKLPADMRDINSDHYCTDEFCELQREPRYFATHGVVPRWMAAELDDLYPKLKQYRPPQYATQRENELKQMIVEWRRIARAERSIPPNRKRRLATAKGDQDITPRAVADRYGWNCHLCGNPIPDQIWHQGLHQPDYVSVDHVVPINHGGSHTWDNVLPAHLGCNMDKGDSIDAQPPR